MTKRGMRRSKEVLPSEFSRLHAACCGHCGHCDRRTRACRIPFETVCYASTSISTSTFPTVTRDATSRDPCMLRKQVEVERYNDGGSRLPLVPQVDPYRTLLFSLAAQVRLVLQLLQKCDIII
jgi:hypothetical protein